MPKRNRIKVMKITALAGNLWSDKRVKILELWLVHPAAVHMQTQNMSMSILFILRYQQTPCAAHTAGKTKALNRDALLSLSRFDSTLFKSVRIVLLTVDLRFSSWKHPSVQEFKHLSLYGQERKQNVSSTDVQRWCIPNGSLTSNFFSRILTAGEKKKNNGAKVVCWINNTI